MLIPGMILGPLCALLGREGSVFSDMMVKFPINYIKIVQFLPFSTKIHASIDVFDNLITKPM